MDYLTNCAGLAPCYSTIMDAINAAVPLDSIAVEGLVPLEDDRLGPALREEQSQKQTGRAALDDTRSVRELVQFPVTFIAARNQGLPPGSPTQCRTRG